MEKKKISGFPVVSENNDLLGMVTRRDTRAEESHRLSVEQIMTPLSRLVIGKDEDDLIEAQNTLYKTSHREITLC